MCNGEQGQTICVCHWRRYQEYEVEKTELNTCSPSKRKKTTYDIWSPLTSNAQQSDFCQRGGCQGKGHVWWQSGGPGVF